MKTVALVLIAVALFVQQPRVDKPETVMVTYHAKAGSEEELARVLARHWATARDMNLMLAAPHVMVRGTEGGGKTYFVEIATWRDESIPDAAPVMSATLPRRSSDMGGNRAHDEIMTRNGHMNGGPLQRRAGLAI